MLSLSFISLFLLFNLIYFSGLRQFRGLIPDAVVDVEPKFRAMLRSPRPTLKVVELQSTSVNGVFIAPRINKVVSTRTELNAVVNMMMVNFVYFLLINSAHCVYFFFILSFFFVFSRNLSVVLFPVTLAAWKGCMTLS